MHTDIPWDPAHPQYFDTVEEIFGEEVATDVARWSAVQHWSLEEGVALSFGFDPRVVNAASLRAYYEHPFASQFDRRIDLARRAVAAGQLKDLNSPKRYIRWAERLGINFPPDLAQMIKLGPSAIGAILSSNPSALTRRLKTLSLIALGITEHFYGLNPEYETIADDLQSAGIPVETEQLKHCLQPVEDLYDNLPEVRGTLSKVMLGLAIFHFGYDPKARRNKATSKIAEVLAESGRSVTDDTINTRLREAASELNLA